MTPEEFFKNLDLTAIVRKSTEKEKPTKLEDGDAEKLCSIVGMNDDPSIVTGDPYGEGWIFKIELEDDEPGLLSSEEYANIVAQ